jgi:transcriptional regulator with XRE-family HTH domain
MDACLLIRERLAELGLGQKDLAAAAEVTESYVSQLLTRKKSPPAPSRTDIYEKMEEFLNLPRGKLSELADLQRMNELRKNLGNVLAPLNEGVRDFVLRKCLPSSEPHIRAEFEKDAFGPLERLVTQKLLDVAKGVAKEELSSENGVHLLARLSSRSFEETRVIILEFLDTDVFTLSAEHCVSFLDPLVESWDIDLVSFGMDVVLNRRLGPGHLKRLEFMEAGSGGPFEEEPGLREFLRDRSLSGGVTDGEIAFLKKLSFAGRRPTPLYYYRELQNLRDPLHFRERGPGTE